MTSILLLRVFLNITDPNCMIDHWGPRQLLLFRTQNTLISYCTLVMEKERRAFFFFRIQMARIPFRMIKLFIYLVSVHYGGGGLRAQRVERLPCVQRGRGKSLVGALGLIAPTPARSPAARRGDWCCRCRNSACWSNSPPPAAGAACSSKKKTQKQ